MPITVLNIHMELHIEVYKWNTLWAQENKTLIGHLLWEMQLDILDSFPKPEGKNFFSLCIEERLLKCLL